MRVSLELLRKPSRATHTHRIMLIWNIFFYVYTAFAHFRETLVLLKQIKSPPQDFRGVGIQVCLVVLCFLFSFFYTNLNNELNCYSVIIKMSHTNYTVGYHQKYSVGIQKIMLSINQSLQHMQGSVLPFPRFSLDKAMCRSPSHFRYIQAG